MGLIYNQVYCFEIRNKVHGSILMKCIQKSNNMWTQCYAQSYKPAETFMPRAGRKKSQGVKNNVYSQYTAQYLKYLC